MQPSERAFADISERSLAELVGPLSASTVHSGLTEAVERTWLVPLKRLQLTDLRLLIGQRRGLEYLVPLAVAHVRDHPLAQATYYRGDLLSALIAVPDEWWAVHPTLVPDLLAAIEKALPRLRRAGSFDELDGPFRAALARLGSRRATG